MQNQDVTNLIDILIIISISIFVLTLYLLPTIVAFTRKHKHKVAILIINLFFGIIGGLGWIVALIWAFVDDKN